MRYSIEGEPLPVVICNLEQGEMMITESGAMSWMSPNMKMETTSNGGFGKMLGSRQWTDRPEIRFSCRGTLCRSVHCVPEKAGKGPVRRRRLHYAEALRLRNCLH